MPRRRHPNKEIEAAVRYAEALGWRFEKSHGHAWGHILCPLHGREGCIVAIWSTPRVPEHHAKGIRRKIDLCRHSHGEDVDEHL